MELAEEQAKVMQLEVEVAKLKTSLDRMADLEKELEGYRREQHDELAAAEARQQRKGGGLWGFISGADASENGH